MSALYCTTIQQALDRTGIRVSEKTGVQSATCPHCSHLRKPKNRKAKCLTVLIDDLGLKWSCAHCHHKGLCRLVDASAGDWANIRTEMSQAIRQPREARQGTGSVDEAARINKARDIWNRSLDPRGTLVERYLNEQRRLELPNELAGTVVRFDPDHWWNDDGAFIRVPALVCVKRHIHTNEIVGIHRTRLSDRGEKVGHSKMLGPIGDAAIKIDANEKVTEGLVISEGFETGLTGRQLGYGPVWALGSAGAMARFPVLSGIDGLSIHEENDANGTNRKAVARCAERWLMADCEVVFIDPITGKDINDALRGGRP